jgi:hypothetical protein
MEKLFVDEIEKVKEEIHIEKEESWKKFNEKFSNELKSLEVPGFGKFENAEFREAFVNLMQFVWKSGYDSSSINMVKQLSKLWGMENLIDMTCKLSDNISKQNPKNN